jgi:hypothetical protein
MVLRSVRMILRIRMEGARLMLIGRRDGDESLERGGFCWRGLICEWGREGDVRGNSKAIILFRHVVLHYGATM